MNVGLSFLRGLIATVNPCGFVLLPTYLMYFLGLEAARGVPGGAEPGAARRGEAERASVRRALLVGAAVTAGFMAVFVVVGAVTKWSTDWVLANAKYVTGLAGVAFVVLGIAMLFGFQLRVAVPVLAAGRRDTTVRSMFVYGVVYATVSLSCTLYLFTPDGLGATVPVKLLQQTEDPEQGLHFSTLTPFEQETPIAAAISIPPELETGYLISVTEQGEVKRLRLEDLPGLTANAFKFMDVEKGDRLIWLGYVEDDDEIVVVTLKGMAIRFSVNDVRPTGMGAGGMRAVKLQGKGDAVVGAAVVEDRANVWVCTDTGVAKSTPLSEYPTQGRAGQGVITMKLPSDAKGLAAATVGRPDDNIVVVTNKGKPKYMRVGLAPETRRNAKGDYIISLRVKEVVSRVVKLLPRLEASALPAVEAEAEEA